MNKIYWNVIPGFSMYEASTNGFIRNAKTKRVLKPFNNAGYRRLRIKSDKGFYKHAGVHQLVALTYISEYTLEIFYSKSKNKPVVDHCDGTRHNNVVTNLRLLTVSENRLAYENIRKNDPLRAKRNRRHGVWYTINDDHSMNFFECWDAANENCPGKDIYFQKHGMNVKPEIVK